MPDHSHLIKKAAEDGLQKLTNELIPMIDTWTPHLPQDHAHHVYLPDVQGYHHPDYIPEKLKPKRIVSAVKATLPHEYEFLTEFFWEQGEMCPAWNTNLKKCETLKQLETGERLAHVVSTSKAFGAVKSRDFAVVYGRERLSDDKTLIYFAPVDDFLIPSTKQYVRGHLGPGGFLYEYLGPNETRLTRIFNEDYAVPSLLWPFFASKIPESGIVEVHNIDRYLRKEPVHVVDLKIPGWLARQFGQ